jgi:hypothetical protein
MCLASIVLSPQARAQIISIKTVPIAEGDQFSIFPSSNLGMGGLSIALADTMLDPFRNPARGARLRVPLFFGSPLAFNVTRNGGSGWTLPVGAIGRSGSLFGGLLVAAQQLDRRGDDPQVFVATDVLPLGQISRIRQPVTTPASSGFNRYAFAMAGRALPAAGLTLAASANWSDLGVIDGVDLLYAGSSGISQRGSSLDLRLGAVKEWSGDRSLEIIVLHNRFAATHDVSFADPVWNPGTRQFEQSNRVEHNADRTNTWGLHAEYERGLGGGWRVGGLATGNYQSHPHIPNYRLMNIPRDPGRSAAWNFGVGVSRVRGPMALGVDLVFEPIVSHTWADASASTETASGTTIPAGGRTIENRFRFHNALMRAGVSRWFELQDDELALRLQLGLQLRGIRYGLDQVDHVQQASRRHEQQWLEATRTWGLSFRFPEVELHYRGRLTSGTGRPGLSGDVLRPGLATSDRSVLIAPSGPLLLDDVRVYTHQVSVTVPIK